MRRRFAFASVALIVVGCTTPDVVPTPAPDSFPMPEVDPVFTYYAPGDLHEGSGDGTTDPTLYAPDLRFPIEDYPAYVNSQVYSPGGMYGGGGSQCDDQNYSYPWRDNFCETRSWENASCPCGAGHQGDDIRPASCNAGLHWAVACADGNITYIGQYSVSLVDEYGTRYRYLHLAMDDLEVEPGMSVKDGDRIGRVSNDFAGTPTTIHLHFDIKMNVAGEGFRYVSPFTSLVKSYETLIGQEGSVISDSG